LLPHIELAVPVNVMDLRIPSGLFFLAIGLIVASVGIFAPGVGAPLTEVNVNLYAGAAMLIFGGILLVLAWRARSAGVQLAERDEDH
jgi:hypothetical protein